MSEDATTKPTLEAVLERVNALGDVVKSLHGDVKNLSEEISHFRREVGIRLDRIESMTNQTRAEMLTLRADFQEFRAQLK